MTTMFSQYPPGTTGDFIVNADGSANLDIKLPKPRAAKLNPARVYPAKQYWTLNTSGLSSAVVKQYLRNCGAMWGFVDSTDALVYFTGRMVPAVIAERLTATDHSAFWKAVDQTGWRQFRRTGPLIINVRDLDPYPY